jgi:hypothetical protein
MQSRAPRTATFAGLAATLVAVVITLAPRLGAQAAPAPQGPAGWSWTLDRPARFQGGGKAIGTDSLFEFSQMAPGWHLTMGPGAVVYDPREQADHRYVLTAELILFPDASMEGEYGVFVGGRGLEGSSAQWSAFVVRGDGSAAVMQRAGGQTRMIMPWTKAESVKPRPVGDAVTNVVQVRAEADSTVFVVNGTRVAAFGRGDLEVNGPFGFRVGPGVNLHITNLDLTRRLAPPRRR